MNIETIVWLLAKLGSNLPTIEATIAQIKGDKDTMAKIEDAVNGLMHIATALSEAKK